MSNVVLKKELVEAIFDWEEVEFWSIKEEGEWIDDGKYSFRESVLFNELTGKYYSVSQSRSGSYYTDYYYDDHTDITDDDEVEQKEFTVIRWVKKS